MKNFLTNNPSVKSMLWFLAWFALSLWAGIVFLDLLPTDQEMERKYRETENAVGSKSPSAFVASMPRAPMALGGYTAGFDAMPAPGTIFSLESMQVVQKTGDGYMLRWADRPGLTEGRIVFLETGAALGENLWFSPYSPAPFSEAMVVGTFSYTAINGFQQTTFRFLPIWPSPTNAFMMRAKQLIHESTAERN